VLTMPATITIGEFSRLTHLPVKTLHHYHDVGVLVPAEVDPATGYRRYTPEQVTDAHLVRRLRDVRMPPAEIRAVLHAAPHEREAGIAAHLDRLHRRLTETATAVASLRALMAGPVPSPVRMREVPAVAAVADRTVISREAIGDYCAEVYPRLFAEVGRSGLQPAGPGAALYGKGWFENDGGEVTAYVPVVAPTLKTSTIPGGRYAVALHIGSFEELDLTYGLLGRHVLDDGLGGDGPIREIYLVGPGDTADPAHWRTEILWPL
jgi:DNA-binding transcriptional MerR regulator